MKTPCRPTAPSLLACAAALGLMSAGSSSGQAATLSVQVDQPGVEPMRIGVFFEDINYGGDGGLYPERVKNRSFEFTAPLMGWKPVGRGGASGTLTIGVEDPLNPGNPHYLRMSGRENGAGWGLSNEGFFGMGVEEGAGFTFSVFGRSTDAHPPELVVEIESADGTILARRKLGGFTPEWKAVSVRLRATATDPKARLNLLLAGPGSLELDMVSLFPQDTWKKRANGLRPDVVQLLADLKPAFLRFPGGCIVEGRDLSKRYQWKTTIGPLEQRKLIVNRWNDEFKHRPAPDYFQSFGLGFFEYFQLCEDLGAAPMPILNCGMACQFNTGELVPLGELDPYIQDALDLIEFANGAVSSPWGSKRAAMGHPRPFNLTLLGVGNEQWGPQYVERYARFSEVLKAKHPEVQLIASAGPRPNDELFHFLWPKLRELKADIVDEHCYDVPAWFFANANRYDAYDRNGPQVFMGEYAAQSVRIASPNNRNNWECALAEAAYLTGLERNSDVVTLSAYAPLTAHVEGWQWTPNLIWFDNLRAHGTPNYYVQQLFSVHRGTRTLPVRLEGQSASAAASPMLFATASRDEKSGEVILKVVNRAAKPTGVDIQLLGAGRVATSGSVTVLRSDSMADENSLAEPRQVAPRTSTVRVAGARFAHEFAAQSLTVLRVKAK